MSVSEKNKKRYSIIFTGGKSPIYFFDTWNSDAEQKVKNGNIVIILGEPQYLFRIEEKIPVDMYIFRFAKISGNFPQNGIAIPVVGYKVLKEVFEQLKLHRGNSFLNKIKIFLLKITASNFICNFLFKNQFLVITKKSSFNIFSYLDNNISRDLVFSIYTGSRKFILPIFKRNGSVFAYGKIYFPGKESEYYGENEVRSLRFLQKLVFESAESPKLLHESNFAECFFITFSSKNGLNNFGKITEDHILWIRELVKKTGKRKKFDESKFASEMDKELNLIKEKLSDESFELVRYFYNEAVNQLREKEYLFSFVNREFAHWELLHHKEKNLVIDWEHARNDWLPIFDVFSLLLSDGTRSKGDYVESGVQKIEKTFFVGNKRNITIINNFACEWKMEKETTYYMFLLFLVDQLYIHLHVDHFRSARVETEFFKKLQICESKFKNQWIK